MANEAQRAKAVIDALSEANVSNAEALAIAEEFTNLTGQGAAPTYVAEQFLHQLARAVSRQVRYNAERRKELELRPDVANAGDAAVDKLPSSIRSARANGRARNPR